MRTTLEAQSAAEGEKPACDDNEHTCDIVEALAVFQPPMFWLKADAE